MRWRENQPDGHDQAHAEQRIKINSLNDPAEFSRLVISYPPCAGEKISLRDTGTFVGLKRELDQARNPFCLAVNHMEGRTRQGDDNAVVLNLNVKPEGRGHPLILCAASEPCIRQR